MKLAQILLACVAGYLITTPVSAGGFCVAENGGCRDIQTGKLYVPEGNKLVDPETKQVYTENQPVKPYIPTQQERLDRLRSQIEDALLAPFRDNRTGYINPELLPKSKTQVVQDAAEAKRQAKIKEEDEEDEEDERRAISRSTSTVRINSGAINTQTGEFLAPAGDGYTGTRDGRYYAPAGPNGVIDTRTGRFVPMH